MWRRVWLLRMPPLRNKLRTTIAGDADRGRFVSQMQSHGWQPYFNHRLTTRAATKLA